MKRSLGESRFEINVIFSASRSFVTVSGLSTPSMRKPDMHICLVESSAIFGTKHPIFNQGHDS